MNGDGKTKINFQCLCHRWIALEGRAGGLEEADPETCWRSQGAIAYQQGQEGVDCQQSNTINTNQHKHATSHLDRANSGVPAQRRAHRR